MWKDDRFQSSLSRTYVAVCYNVDMDGHYFRKFHLPLHGETHGSVDENGLWVEGSFTPAYENTCAKATWYFINILNIRVNVECSIPLEQYEDIKDQDEINRQDRILMERIFAKDTVRPRKKKSKTKKSKTTI